MIAFSIAKKPKAKKAKLASLIASMKRSVSTTVKPTVQTIQIATILFAPNTARMQPIIALIAHTMLVALAISAANMPIMRILAPSSIARNTAVLWMLAAVNKSTIANNIVPNTLAATIPLA
jgi:NADH:ubiquinone oxidoreductase subunit 2 (subunit N)